MKRVPFVVFSIVIMGSTSLLSLFLTVIAWHVQIEDKAFHCTDDNLSGWICGIDTHREAGDTISPGWTWHKLELVRDAYEAAFVLIWLGTAAPIFFVVGRARISDHFNPTLPQARIYPLK
jgi:hypothetical protein